VTTSLPETLPTIAATGVNHIGRRRGKRILVDMLAPAQFPLQIVKLGAETF